MKHRYLSLFVAASTLSTTGLAATEGPLPFAEAVFTEVINDVQVVHARDAKAEPAKPSAKFFAPDLVKTGRKSRAQLTAADGTVARIGSNAVFSFDKDSRTMNLERGSVLFHSPTGKGGGTIVTNSATASVIGTTIVVSATSDGGFKLLVLEGVAKVVFPNGAVSTVNAGQMTFVLPGSTVEKQAPKSERGESRGESKGEGERGGLPGPILNFDLSAVKSESGLVGGFKTELPSLGKIRLAMGEQRERIGDGELRTTGLPILGATDEQTTIIGDPTVIQQAIQLLEESVEPTDAQRMIADSKLPLSLDGATPPDASFVFLTKTLVPAELLPAGAGPEQHYLRGLVAGDLALTGSAFDLGFLRGDAHADLIGFGSITFGNITFQGAPGMTSLRVGGGRVNIAPGSTVSVKLDGTAAPATPTWVEFVAFTAVTFDAVTFDNATGDVRLSALTGDLRMNGGAITSHPTLGTVDVHAGNGSVLLTSTVVTGGAGAYFSGNSGVTLDGVSVTAAHINLYATAGAASIVNGSVLNATGANSIWVGTNGLTVADSTLTSAGAVSLEANGGNADLTHATVRGAGVRVHGAAVTISGGAAATAATFPGTELDAGAGELALSATGNLTVTNQVSAHGGVVSLAAAKFDATDARFAASAGAITVNAADTRLTRTALTGATGAYLTGAGKTEILDGSTLAVTSGQLRVSAGNGITLATATLTAGGPVELLANGSALDATASTVRGAGIRAQAAALTLTGYAGTYTPPIDALPVPGSEWDAGAGVLTLSAAGNFTTTNQVYAHGGTVNLQAGNFDATDAKFEAGSGALMLNAASTRLTRASLIGVAGVGVSGPGRLDLLSGSLVSATAGDVTLNGGLIALDGAGVSATGAVSVHATGGIDATGAWSSVSGASVSLVADTAAINLGAVTVQASGAPSPAAPTGPVSPSGLHLAGNGITLADGAVLTAGQGGASLEARLYNLSVTRAAITAEGVDLSGAAIGFTGVGGSKDANSGVVTPGGTVDAGLKMLTVTGASLYADGYTQLRGAGVWVDTTGDVTLSQARLEANGGGKSQALTNGTPPVIPSILDVRAVNLTVTDAALAGAGGMNLLLTGRADFTDATVDSGAQVHIEATGLAVTGTTINAGTDLTVFTKGAQVWDGGSVTTSQLTLGGLATAIPDRIALTGTSLTVSTATITAHTVELSGVNSYTEGAAWTLYSDLGLLNGATGTGGYAVQAGYVNLEYFLVYHKFGQTDPVNNPIAGLIWSPAENLGNTDAPIHILKIGDTDYRGTRHDYAVARDFDSAAYLKFNALPSAQLFRSSAPELLNYSDFGLSATDVLPGIDGGGTHSLYDVQGLLARNITITGALTIDLNVTNPDSAYGEINSRVDLVATRTFTISGALTTTGSSYSHRRLEMRGSDVVFNPGASYTSTLPYDSASQGDLSAVMFAAVNTAKVNGSTVAPCTIGNPAGTVEIGAALGTVTLNYTNVSAGFQANDGVYAIQPGRVSLTTFAPGLVGTITVVGGSLQGHAAGGATDVGVDISGAYIDLSNVLVKAESRSMITAGTEPVYSSGIGGGTYGGQTDISRGQYKPSGAVHIYGTKLVQIVGGTLVAADLKVGASPATVAAGGSLDDIVMDGMNFLMAGSQGNGTGITMEAKTVSLKNIVFPDKVQVRLRAQDGGLNLITNGSAAMFGAVNFEYVGLRAVGTPGTPSGTVMPLTDENGVNSKVWIENHNSVSNNKVFYNGAVAPSTTTGAASPSVAPIHIQALGSPNQPGQY